MQKPGRIAILQTLIQSGILFTLLGLAYALGQTIQRFDYKFDDHEKRISKIETKVF